MTRCVREVCADAICMRWGLRERACRANRASYLVHPDRVRCWPQEAERAAQARRAAEEQHVEAALVTQLGAAEASPAHASMPPPAPVLGSGAPSVSGREPSEREDGGLSLPGGLMVPQRQGPVRDAAASVARREHVLRELAALKSDAGSGGRRDGDGGGDAPAVGVEADLTVLRAARQRAATGVGEDDAQDAARNEVGWAPPAGQTGDGRTSLNDRLGY